MGAFSIWHWLIVLVVIVLVFGTKKLGSAGSDLGKAVRGFKQGMKESGDGGKPAIDGGAAAEATVAEAAAEETPEKTPRAG